LAGEEHAADKESTTERASGTGVELAEPTPHLQSAEEALEQDLRLAAEANGWTVEQAAAQHLAAEIVGRIAGEVAGSYPEIFVGSALSDVPGGVPELYIKGPADEFVRAQVAAAGIEIRIVDNQPYSFAELEARRHAASR
jgi:hypothetical protein